MLILALLLAGSAGLLLYLGFSIQPGELQVVVHYTSFGTTNFYRDKWYYLLSFSAFAIIMAVMHIALTYKVLIQKGHDMAVAFAWLGVVLLVMSLLDQNSVEMIAFLLAVKLRSPIFTLAPGRSRLFCWIVNCTG